MINHCFLLCLSLCEKDVRRIRKQTQPLQYEVIITDAKQDVLSSPGIAARIPYSDQD